MVATLFQHYYTLLPKKLFRIVPCNITFKDTYIRRDCWILGLASKSTNKSTEERLVVGPSPLIRKVNTSWKVWWIFFALKSWSKETTMLSVYSQARKNENALLCLFKWTCTRCTSLINIKGVSAKVTEIHITEGILFGETQVLWVWSSTEKLKTLSGFPKQKSTVCE